MFSRSFSAFKGAPPVTHVPPQPTWREQKLRVICAQYKLIAALPVMVTACCREAELSTFTGWVRIHAAAAAAAVSGILQHWQRGGRVAPAQTDSSSNRQRQSVDAPPDKDARSRGHSSTGFAASRGGVPDAHAAQHVLATLHAAC